MRRAISALIALALAIWSALVVRWTYGIPVLWSVAFCFGCGPTVNAISVAPDLSKPDRPRKPDTTGVVRFIGYGGFGQGCPFEKHRAFTARHMAVKEGPFQTSANYYIWSDMNGASGSAWYEDYDLRRDLAIMRSDRAFKSLYPLATEAPIPGETLTIVGYDLNEGEPMKPSIVEVKLKNIVSAHLMLGKGGRQGFSGSCVLNERNEAVGIFHWTIKDGFTEFGVASAVYGEWGRIDWRPSK